MEIHLSQYPILSILVGLFLLLVSLIINLKVVQSYSRFQLESEEFFEKNENVKWADQARLSWTARTLVSVFLFSFFISFMGIFFLWGGVVTLFPSLVTFVYVLVLLYYPAYIYLLAVESKKTKMKRSQSK
jgi:phosphatidylglycerophosphate synthase